jgi:phosphate transport system permease protein
MTVAEPPPPPATGNRPTTREALLAKRRGWFFGIPGDRIAHLVFQGNATISIVVLALITFTIFRDAVGFIPQNRENLQVYRLAGLELVDILRRQVDDHAAISRYLTRLRLDRLEQLTKREGKDVAAANAELAGFDAFADRFASTISAHETILANMGDHVSSVKERYRVASDLREARANLEAALVGATPERAAILQAEIDGMEIETVNFAAEIAPLLAMLPEVYAANDALAASLQEVVATTSTVQDETLRKRLERLPELVRIYSDQMRERAAEMAAWRPGKPVSWWESFTAFAFGRKWVTASFWQDWYGIVPLFAGSLLIAALALALAIPLGIAAAVYINQVANPTEQKVIKPAIEFVAAIPSVVLGFFGIAVLGESLRRLSQLPALDWVPGFPMLERLNAATAACLLGLMAVPTIFSLAEDAINNVPRAYKEASLALGATRLQTIVRITIPAALSGIMAAVLLGFGRVIGETMVVLLCAGNRIEIPDFTLGGAVLFQPVHTMTGIIAQEMGEVVRHSIHYRALFMVGAVLFLISLLINWLAQKIVRRYRLRSA